MCLLCSEINLQEIKELNVCHKIKKISPELINLEYLSCDCNELIKFIPENLIKLETLYCRMSNIKNIPQSLINLKKLSCYNSEVSEIPKELINLEYIDCVMTCISEIPKELINLKNIYCKYSDITEIPKELINLKELVCCYTEITEIPKELINLEYVNCIESKITEIPKELINLEKLQCSKELEKIIKDNIDEYNLTQLNNTKINKAIHITGNLIKYESDENCYICLEKEIEYKCYYCTFLVHRKCLEDWFSTENTRRECMQCRHKYN